MMEAKVPTARAKTEASDCFMVTEADKEMSREIEM